MRSTTVDSRVGHVAIAARDYAGPEDLSLMQALTAECWRLEGPYVPATIGDLAWLMYQHLDKLSETQIRLWQADAGKLVGWGWLWFPDALILLIHPGHRAALVGEIADWFEGEARPGDDPLTVTVLEHDSVARAAFEARGYEPNPDETTIHFVRSLDEPIDEPRVPEGYMLRTVAGEVDVERRVDVHRAAFAPSRVVPDSYRATMRAHPYRLELDNVVEAPDGSFAAFCLCWLDADNAVGELEPVGTHPDHQRQGLARAVSLAGLHGLRARGARTAVVYAVAGGPAVGLYEGLGFCAVSRHLELQRPREGSVRP